MKKLSLILALITVMTISCREEKHGPSTEDQMKKFVGKNVLLQNDTLTIVDYSSWNETYTLYPSNIKVDRFAAERNIIE